MGNGTEIENDPNKSNYTITDALAKARSMNQYVLSVEMLTGKSASTEEAKAFLLYLAESVFDPGDERDIVLASWRLLQGFELLYTRKECHKLFKELSAYRGTLGGLNHKETALYRDIANYYKYIEDKDAFWEKAMRAKLPNKKGKVQLPELYNKKVAASAPPVSPPELEPESQPEPGQVIQPQPEPLSQQGLASETGPVLAPASEPETTSVQKYKSTTSRKWVKPMIAGMVVVLLAALFFASRNQSANTSSDALASDNEASTISYAGNNDGGEQQNGSTDDADGTPDVTPDITSDETPSVPIGANITYDLTYADGDGEGEYWGDSGGGRQAYTKDEIDSGVLGDSIVFNSITDGEYGDERNFVGAALVNDEETIWYGDSIEVEDGKTYVVCLYVRNDNPDGLNAIAEDVRVLFDLPDASSKSLTITGFIESSNAEPDRYWDSVTLYSNENFSINYIENSARYINSRMQDIPLSVDIIERGVPLGYENFDGMFPGGYGHDGIVTIKVAVHNSSTIELTTEARLKGTYQWADEVFANIGDEVEFQITYRNHAADAVENVMVYDHLPPNMVYVEGSTYLYNSEIRDGALVKSDAVTTDGINIGSNYQSRANAYVRFTARVVDNDLLYGENLLENWANATVNGEVIRDDVTIKVTKR